MGLDEEHGTFFGQPIITLKPKPGERFMTVDLGHGMHVIMQGTAILADTATLARINRHSKSDYAGKEVPGRLGIIDRITR